jgi:hypothetical protein
MLKAKTFPPMQNTNQAWGPACSFTPASAGCCIIRIASQLLDLRAIVPRLFAVTTSPHLVTALVSASPAHTPQLHFPHICLTEEGVHPRSTSASAGCDHAHATRRVS